MLNILLADDHPLLLNGMEQFIIKKGYQLCSSVTDGLAAYNTIVKQQPDIAILDFDMLKMNGLEIAQQCVQNNIATKIIILTLHKQEAILQEVGKTIQAYLTKDANLDEIDCAIEAIIAGKYYVGNSLQVIEKHQNDSISQYNLTATELKILKYIEGNLSSVEIAEQLFISKRTVEKHRSNIIKKIGLDTTKQNALLLWAKHNLNLN